MGGARVNGSVKGRTASPKRYPCGLPSRLGESDFRKKAGACYVVSSPIGWRKQLTRMSEAVLVTGGAGYIGSHACKALARAGYRPVVFDNLSRGHRAAVRWGPLVEGDLADRDKLAVALGRVSVVMHFAAYAYVGESMTKPELYFRNNVVNSLGLLECLNEAGIRREDKRREVGPLVVIARDAAGED